MTNDFAAVAAAMVPAGAGDPAMLGSTTFGASAIRGALSAYVFACLPAAHQHSQRTLASAYGQLNGLLGSVPATAAMHLSRIMSTLHSKLGDTVNPSPWMQDQSTVRLLSDARCSQCLGSQETIQLRHGAESEAMKRELEAAKRELAATRAELAAARAELRGSTSTEEYATATAPAMLLRRKRTRPETSMMAAQLASQPVIGARETVHRTGPVHAEAAESADLDDEHDDDDDSSPPTAPPPAKLARVAAAAPPPTHVQPLQQQPVPQLTCVQGRQLLSFQQQFVNTISAADANNTLAGSTIVVRSCVGSGKSLTMLALIETVARRSSDSLALVFSPTRLLQACTATMISVAFPSLNVHTCGAGGTGGVRDARVICFSVNDSSVVTAEARRRGAAATIAICVDEAHTLAVDASFRPAFTRCAADLAALRRDTRAATLLLSATLPQHVLRGVLRNLEIDPSSPSYHDVRGEATNKHVTYDVLTSSACGVFSQPTRCVALAQQLLHNLPPGDTMMMFVTAVADAVTVFHALEKALPSGSVGLVVADSNMTAAPQHNLRPAHEVISALANTDDPMRIVVGTCLAAVGVDVPSCKLVLIASTVLGSLVQAAGRCGRGGTRGRVVIAVDAAAQTRLADKQYGYAAAEARFVLDIATRRGACIRSRLAVYTGTIDARSTSTATCLATRAAPCTDCRAGTGSVVARAPSAVARTPATLCALGQPRSRRSQQLRHLASMLLQQTKKQQPVRVIQTELSSFEPAVAVEFARACSLYQVTARRDAMYPCTCTESVLAWMYVLRSELRPSTVASRAPTCKHGNVFSGTRCRVCADSKCQCAGQLLQRKAMCFTCHLPQHMFSRRGSATSLVCLRSSEHPNCDGDAAAKPQRVRAVPQSSRMKKPPPVATVLALAAMRVALAALRQDPASPCLPAAMLRWVVAHDMFSDPVLSTAPESKPELVRWISRPLLASSNHSCLTPGVLMACALTAAPDSAIAQLVPGATVLGRRDIERALSEPLT